MHILVLNGSPKGENSITLQTVRYLEILYPDIRMKFTIDCSRGERLYIDCIRQILI